VRIALLVALSDNAVIGRQQQLPWHLPDDLKRFKALTMGKAVLMGRRTYVSIGRPLPGRRNLVLTRASLARGSLAPAALSAAAAGSLPAGTSLEPVGSLEAALAACAGAEELCVIGGAEVFRQTLNQATHLHLTRVHAHVEGDVRFPEIDMAQWREFARSEHPIDARHALAMSFIDYQRR